MSRGPLPKTVALRDQVLAALRERDGFPVATQDVPALLGLRATSYGYGGETWCQGCRRSHHEPVLRYPGSQEVYVALRALHKAGLVDKVCFDSRQAVYWQAFAADGVQLDPALIDGLTGEG